MPCHRSELFSHFIGACRRRRVFLPSIPDEQTIPDGERRLFQPFFSNRSRWYGCVVAGLFLLGMMPAAGYSWMSGPISAKARSGIAADASRPVADAYRVVQSYPHDPLAFTQGLVYHDGVLYEGTGLYGESSLRRTDISTGTILKMKKLEPNFFGEGIALRGNHLVQLTYQNGVGFVYDRNTFRETGRFRYDGEGWGITHDGRRWIMSDGTATLRFLHTETFQVLGRLEVRWRGAPLPSLNELEWVQGDLYANVWPTNYIARIDPVTGLVRETLDLSPLHAQFSGGDVDVLNGIAYDSRRDRLFVTGKKWPRLFEIRRLEVKKTF